MKGLVESMVNEVESINAKRRGAGNKNGYIFYTVAMDTVEVVTADDEDTFFDMDFEGDIARAIYDLEIGQSMIVDGTDKDITSRQDITNKSTVICRIF